MINNRTKPEEKNRILTNGSTKSLIIAGLIKAIHEHLYVESDEERFKEFSTYEKRENVSY